MRRAEAWLFALLSAGCLQSNASFPEEPSEPQGDAPAEQKAESAPPLPESETKTSPSRATPGAATPDSPSGLTAPGSPFVELTVPHHRPAVVSIPVGATSRRPVL